MWTDPIVAEVRRHREEYARDFDYDLKRIFADLKRRERERLATEKQAKAEGKPKPAKKPARATAMDKPKPALKPKARRNASKHKRPAA